MKEYVVSDILEKNDSEALELVRETLELSDDNIMSYVREDDYAKRAFLAESKQAMYSILGQFLFKPVEEIKLTYGQRKYVNMFIFNFHPNVWQADRDYYRPRYPKRRRRWHRGSNSYYHPTSGDYTDYF